MENIIIRVVVNFRKYFPKKYLLLRVPTGTFDNFVEWQVPLFFFFFFLSGLEIFVLIIMSKILEA